MPPLSKTMGHSSADIGRTGMPGDATCDLPTLKCVLVGDGAIGKTSLLVSYTTQEYPSEYIPTAFDNYAVVVQIEEKPMRLQLYDTAGQDEFDSLRQLCYTNTDIFLICFSVVCPTSLYNITDKWLPEIRRHRPDTPIILVGTQSDLRGDPKVLQTLSRYGEKPVTEVDANSLAQEMGALAYIECSALTQHCVKDVFDSAIFAALDQQGFVRKSRGLGSIRGSKKYRCKSTLWTSLNNVHSVNATPAVSTDKRQKKLWKSLLCCMM